MAKLDPQTLIGILRGKLGNLVFVRATDGTVIVKHPPRRTAEFSAGELGNQSRFTLAAAYVKAVRQQPDLYAAYQSMAREKGKRACNLAHADFRHPPVILGVDLELYRGNAGETIRVQAADDFGVASVQVTLAQLDGIVLEQGEAHAEPNGAGTWQYVSTTTIPPGQTILVLATAKDRPGNAVSKGYHHALMERGLPSDAVTLLQVLRS